VNKTFWGNKNRSVTGMLAIQPAVAVTFDL
jgi:hypothetical protein